MKDLPEKLRQILRDLVEKRLWPVAVLLLAVAIGAPMLIGGSATEPEPLAPLAAASPAATTAAPPAGAEDAVSGAKAKRGGKIDDPFYDPPTAPATSTSTATATATAPPAGGGAAASAAATRSGANAAPAAGNGAIPAQRDMAMATTTGTDRSRTKAVTVPPVYYRTVVRWGLRDKAASHPIARLTPLGGRDDPAALFLGATRSKGIWAIFVLGPNASSRGDGTCRTGTDCRMIGLRAGDTQIITVRGNDGRVVRRFSLEVRSVKKVVTSRAIARTMRARVHPDGRGGMRTLRRDPVSAAVLGRAGYNRNTGLLYAVASRDGQQAAR